jgi:outer membrane protein insertion porin family
MILFLRLFLLICALLHSPAIAAESDGPLGNIDSVRQLRGTRVAEVEFSGDKLSDVLKARFEALRGKPFQPTALRALLIWAHENGGDFLIRVDSKESRGSLRLEVKVQQKKKITAVKFEGNSAMIETALEPIVELKEGSEYEREAVASAAQRLTIYYSKQGYLFTEVKSEFNSGVLTFRINEGEPTLLDSFGLSPLVNVERRDLRGRYERELTEAFGLKVGNRIQRDRVLEGIQAVKDWLRDHDFLMAKDPSLEYRVDESGKVGLFLNIEYGPRIRFGFRGNTQFSYRELMVLVGEIKEVASGNEYLAAVRRRIMDAYKEIGLANAEINTLIKEDPARGIRYVSLLINEGSKIRLERINIEGVYSMEEKDAVKEFKSVATRLVQRDFYDEEGITKAAALFAEKLQSRGYLSAKLEYLKTDFNAERTKVSLTLLYTEGIQTSVQEVRLAGISAFSREEVLKMLTVEEGKPFDIFSFEKGVNTLKEAYQEIGHLSAQVVNEASDSIVKYSRDNSGVILHVEVDEGPTFTVGDVLVRGNDKTHARVVLREMPFISGDVLTGPLLTEAEDNLRKLNIFSSVILRPIDRPGADNIKDILILVEESAPGYFDIVPGFRNDLGLRLGLELGYQNVGGWNRTVTAQAIINRRVQDYRYPEYLFSLGFREPYLANWPVVFTSNLTLFRRQFPHFDADVDRITISVRRDLTRWFSTFLEYNFERNKITNVSLPYDKSTDERTDLIGSFTPGFSVDSRNDRFNPSSGLLSMNRFEVASNYFGSQDSVGFYRFTSFNSAYFKLFDYATLALAMNMGWERSNVAGQPIPTFKLFRTGGIGSIRGYAEDAIEVETSKNVTGTLGLLNYRAELRVPLIGNFGTALFMDAGNLMVDRYSFNPTELKSSAGAGLRYVTPVGPVLLDFAWRLQNESPTLINDGTSDRGNPADRFRVHFAIGAF